jgi:hypothetical protein
MDNTTRRLMMGAAGAVSPTYIEDVFSTWLYTGNSSTQTITNGIDLAGKGGLVWLKDRDNANGHFLTDSARGVNSQLRTHSTAAATAGTDFVTALNSTGFTLGSNGNVNGTATEVSWTFRKQAKFFDVVTYTGDGVSGRTVSHNLGSVPGCILIKRTDGSGTWFVYHRSTGNTGCLFLNTTDAFTTVSDAWNNTTPTSSVFSLGNNGNVNQNTLTYVAYLFAHDAGGFGDTGSDSVVKCGSFSDTGFVNLGWEPQWLLIKPYSQVYNWEVYDNMRGMGQPGGASSARVLKPNLSDAEAAGSSISFEATGFTQTTFGATYPCIYIAIRRGPMKTPTDATKVFTAQTFTGTGTNSRVFTGFGFPLDGLLIGSRDAVAFGSFWIIDRLRGFPPKLQTSSTSGDSFNDSSYFVSNLASMDGYTGGTLDNNQVNNSGSTRVQYGFRRAPGFFDVVAYGPGTGATLTVNHNLGVLPEWVIYKSRSSGGQWVIQNRSTNYGFFNSNAFSAGSVLTTLTSTSFSLNVDGNTYIAYLFASCPGVSKVGSYTGTGTTLQINCGFTSGARFVLIKRTDSTGDWYVWDSARGIIAGNDPYLLLNSTAAEVTGTDYVDTFSAGFEISSTAPAAINANGGSYIYLSVA